MPAPAESQRLHELLDRFTGRSMLVLGDVILDRYWWGECHRLSPEAPVPIVRKQRATVRPGGAANTAANLVALGASAEVAGVVGVDDVARELRGVLAECGIGDALVEDASRPTTSKTRIVALHQQVVRVDEEDTHPLADAVVAEVLRGFERRLKQGCAQCHGVVLSDYAKGFLTPDLLRGVIDAAAKAGVKTFVDPKGPDYERYRGGSLLKPTRLELALLPRTAERNHDETPAAGRTRAPWMPATTIPATEGTAGLTRF